jgi:hypothetical protein
MAIGIVYPQYWLNPLVVEGSFFLHLNVIKFTFFVAHKTIDGIMVPLLLDSHMLDVQSSYFRLTMSHNVEGAMAEQSKSNPMIRLWMRIFHFEWKSQRVQQIGKDYNGWSVRVCWGWKSIQQFFFMKNKLWNQLTTHLNLCVKMFSY